MLPTSLPTPHVLWQHAPCPWSTNSFMGLPMPLHFLHGCSQETRACGNTLGRAGSEGLVLSFQRAPKGPELHTQQQGLQAAPQSRNSSRRRHKGTPTPDPAQRCWLIYGTAREVLVLLQLHLSTAGQGSISLTSPVPGSRREAPLLAAGLEFLMFQAPALLCLGCSFKYHCQGFLTLLPLLPAEEFMIPRLMDKQ